MKLFKQITGQSKGGHDELQVNLDPRVISLAFMPCKFLVCNHTIQIPAAIGAPQPHTRGAALDIFKPKFVPAKTPSKHADPVGTAGLLPL